MFHWTGWRFLKKTLSIGMARYHWLSSFLWKHLHQDWMTGKGNKRLLRFYFRPVSLSNWCTFFLIILLLFAHLFYPAADYLTHSDDCHLSSHFSLLSCKSQSVYIQKDQKSQFNIRFECHVAPYIYWGRWRFCLQAWHNKWFLQQKNTPQVSDQ